MDYQALMVGPGAKLEVANLFIEGEPGHIHLKLKIVFIDQTEPDHICPGWDQDWVWSPHLACWLEDAGRDLLHSAITVHYQRAGKKTGGLNFLFLKKTDNIYDITKILKISHYMLSHLW